MLKIPPQVLLVAGIVATVAVKTISPIDQLNKALSLFDGNQDGYSAPLVSSATQSEYLTVLKLDLKNIKHQGAHYARGAVAFTASVQSYNNIANQMNPDALRKNNMPTCIN